MKAVIFDGKEFARKKEKLLKKEVTLLFKKGIKPKLVSILVGTDPASKLYTSLKKKAAEKVGCEMEVREFSEKISVDQLAQLIKHLNEDTSTHGIMIQLPLPARLKDKTQKLVEKIDPTKDVDGLKEDSKFIPATVKAVLQIIENAKSKLSLNLDSKRFIIVGSKGEVGRRLLKELQNKGYKVYGYDIETKNLGENTKKADILISATGVPNLIKDNMVKDGVVLIDVGSPIGDMDKKACKKASFVSLVPGGVGPVTISCLLENLVGTLDR